MPMSKKDLDEAKANLKAHARKEITKRELIQFRCEADLMGRLLDLAGARKQPLGPMIREWVVERLALEEAKQAGNEKETIVSHITIMETNLQELKRRVSTGGYMAPSKAVRPGGPSIKPGAPAGTVRAAAAGKKFGVGDARKVTKRKSASAKSKKKGSAKR